jgi:hypothetical protein
MRGFVWHISHRDSGDHTLPSKANIDRMISAEMQNILRCSWRHDVGNHGNMPPLIIEGRNVKCPKKQIHDDGRLT